MATRVDWRVACGLGAVLWAGGAQAATIGTGPFGQAPRITGVVTVGQAAKVALTFAEPLKRPLVVDIAPGSHPLELMKIGLWMRERRPDLELRGSCVGACAKSILMSGRVTHIEPGTVIAFGGATEMKARIKDQIDAGDLFIQSDELGAASRDHFLQQQGAAIALSQAVRTMAAQQAPLPLQVKAFVDAVTGSWTTKQVTFGLEPRFAIKADRHRCWWWVPDAEGLRQLGLEVPGYQPASRSDAARLLKVTEGYIHVGPVPDVLPEQSLCPGDKNVRFHELP
jgi:hypothetical protein